MRRAMAKTTIKQMAQTMGLSVDKVLEHFVGAGLRDKKATDEITEKEKMQLIAYLHKDKAKAGAGGKAAAVRRKSHKQLKVGRGYGRVGSVVEVEIRRRRTAPKDEPVKEVRDQAKEKEEPKANAQAAPKPKAEKAPPKKQPAPVAPRPLEKKPQSAPKAPPAAKSPAAQLNESPAVKPSRKEAAPRSRKQLRIDSTRRTRRRRKEPAPPIRKTVKVDSAAKHAFEKPTEPVKREVMVPETITVADLAQRMAIKRGELVKLLVNMNIMATINQVLDQDTAMLIVDELGHVAKPEKKGNEEDNLARELEADTSTPVPRPPIVVVMGHVDHGKTSLLDYIRRSRVADQEAGGITQHIGAYHVETDLGMITFLDTPGHEAFTSMRARGTRLTDIAVLVVAADDGVMPQTLEAIEHAKAADVPIIVALSKSDKEGADPEKVKGDLARHGVVAEDWGGDSIMVAVSAKTGENIDNLLEAISLQAEVMELKASDEGSAVATVVESSRDKGRGVVATVLIQRGILRKGDVLLAGTEYGRVRAMVDEYGNKIEQVGPSIPAVVFGLSGTPSAGERANVVDSERRAREIASLRRNRQRADRLTVVPVHSDEMFASEDVERSELRILIRADVKGTAEALRDSLERIQSDEVKVKILSNLVGGITVSDINLATASHAVVIGFNARADAAARKAAENQGVAIHYYNVIYEVIDDVKKMMSDMLAPEVKEEVVGVASVKDTFRSSRFGTVAGCQVIEGAVKRGSPIRVLRDNIVIFEGELESLRRHKDDASEVNAGTECGIAVKDYNDVKVGDQIEVYERTETPRSI